MLGPSTLNFTLPVWAERYGRTLQAGNRFSVFIDQIILGEHERGKYCGSALNQIVRNWANSTGRGPAHLKNTKTTD